MIESFHAYLQNKGLKENSIKGYLQSVKGYLKWFDESKDVPFQNLHRENVLEYISFLKTVKKLNPKTINTKLSGLIKFNQFLMEEYRVQTKVVIGKKDFERVQQQYASLSTVEYHDVEKFRQVILDNKHMRYYALATIFAYAGLRLSEALDLHLHDVHLVTREITVREGKGDKTRIVYMSEKVRTALQSWLKERKNNGVDSEYLFPSNRNRRLDRTVVNTAFQRYAKEVGKKITPHVLRHFFCSNAIAKGLSIHEVANQAGHSNIHTTLLYTNPTKTEMLDKMDQL
ncbi:tyrosine-type recombinase/integrase [Lentibacillus cibarius]|uniref:Transposase n=1 Tax=Lentibacillus cibarius TaxID=2583219 RepID=A0A5S3R7U8_9BACI|nr:tyrosine-type recombinase/integrase [Lentibacillus cibarius]TMN22683.1 transposase [Lentibacillus cibarius]